MKKLLPIFIFLIFAPQLQAQNFRVQTQTITTTNPDSCSNIDVDVLTWLGCINFSQGPATYQVNGNVIDIEVNYNSAFICAGAISQPLFQLSLQNIPAGTYTLNSSALLDNVVTNTISGSLTVAGCSTTGLNENILSDLQFFPNPVKDILTIQLPQSIANPIRYKLLTINGKEIFNGSFTAAANNFVDISQLAKGIYFIELSQGQHQKIHKVVKH